MRGSPLAADDVMTGVALGKHLCYLFYIFRIKSL